MRTTTHDDIKMPYQQHYFTLPYTWGKTPAMPEWNSENWQNKCIAINKIVVLWMMCFCHRVLNPVWSFSRIHTNIQRIHTHLHISATHYINFSLSSRARPQSPVTDYHYYYYYYFACSNDMQSKWWWWVAHISIWFLSVCVWCGAHHIKWWRISWTWMNEWNEEWGNGNIQRIDTTTKRKCGFEQNKEP